MPKQSGQHTKLSGGARRAALRRANRQHKARTTPRFAFDIKALSKLIKESFSPGFSRAFGPGAYVPARKINKKLTKAQWLARDRLVIWNPHAPSFFDRLATYLRARRTDDAVL